MPADVLTFADAVAAALQAAFTAAEAVVTVGREYEAEFDLGTMSGLKCCVFPAAYRRESAATRRENHFEPEVTVIVAERYTPAGRPTKAWLDARTALAESCVFDVLEKIDLPNTLDGHWVREIECTCVCDRTLLRENKVFWTEFEATFRKVRATK